MVEKALLVEKKSNGSEKQRFKKGNDRKKRQRLKEATIEKAKKQVRKCNGCGKAVVEKV